MRSYGNDLHKLISFQILRNVFCFIFAKPVDLRWSYQCKHPLSLASLSLSIFFRTDCWVDMQIPRSLTSCQKMIIGDNAVCFADSRVQGV